MQAGGSGSRGAREGEPHRAREFNHAIEPEFRLLPEESADLYFASSFKIGAGIQVPPNGTRIARQLGYLDKLLERGVIVDKMELRRYANGKHLFSLSAKECMEQYGDLWMVCHRADCHAALWETCMSLGVDLCLDMDVERIDFATNTVWLEDGDDISGDVIIGADGGYGVVVKDHWFADTKQVCTQYAATSCSEHHHQQLRQGILRTERHSPRRSSRHSTTEP